MRRNQADSRNIQCVTVLRRYPAGGRGGTAIQQVIYDQEEARYAVPRGIFEIGLGMCIPTLCTWGTQAQRDRYDLPRQRQLRHVLADAASAGPTTSGQSVRILASAKPRRRAGTSRNTLGAAITINAPPVKPETKRHSENQANDAGSAQQMKLIGCKPR